MTAMAHLYTIMVVDDTDFMVEVLRDIFSEAGYKVVSAKDAEQALELYPRLLPDLITIDILMPGLDGLALLQKLRQLDPAVKAVMISAVTNQETVMASIKGGAKTFVGKPFDRETLLGSVARALEEY